MGRLERHPQQGSYVCGVCTGLHFGCVVIMASLVVVWCMGHEGCNPLGSPLVVPLLLTTVFSIYLQLKYFYEQVNIDTKWFNLNFRENVAEILACLNFKEVTLKHPCSDNLVFNF